MPTAEDSLTLLQIIPIGLGVLLFVAALPQLIRLLMRAREFLGSYDTQKTCQDIIESDKDTLRSIILLVIADIILLITGFLFPRVILIRVIEIPISLTTCLTMVWLGYHLIKRSFKIYVTTLTLSGRKLNEDLLIVARWLTFLVYLFVIITIFSQFHAINIFGLIASLGVGGIAIAFAAQKTLEQLFGGIVLFLDPPFSVDDYINLPDSTFGKVESIGLRTTKIRTSGKGTLIVVPNNYLAGINIENFSDARKIISIIKINFLQRISEIQKAFICQLIRESINGTEIDSRGISISFHDIDNEMGQKIIEGQVKFFIQSAGESSRDFRLQIINIIGENIQQKLMDNGIEFEIVDRVWIDSQISI